MNLSQDETARLFVLRVWYEPNGSARIWRASVLLGERRRYFLSPLDLMVFLEEEVMTRHLSAPD
ncbi:hypothetical protein [Deinococcus yavapaiensis]|uniref:Uncharacterized protein n=1 Tax=Deinococcus yavapaiensis KR-236 TaxID=694435 RepID=A0A318S977_9DEIO|nr:hypothetical protein [Deinococcus yavapaiensis]PYE52757.1 hypothetical protein DES52_11278 [Deinococcus yavapaiensis KR-236]